MIGSPDGPRTYHPADNPDMDDLLHVHVGEPDAAPGVDEVGGGLDNPPRGAEGEVLGEVRDVRTPDIDLAALRVAVEGLEEYRNTLTAIAYVDPFIVRVLAAARLLLDVADQGGELS